MSHETSIDYAHPFRPAPLRWANAALGAVRGLGPLGVDLSVGSLESAARRRTKLHDLGPADYREPLTRLVRSIEDEARLHPIGRLITRTRLVSTLANRARLEALYRAFPRIDEQPLHRPVVIVGLPRTGTTLLHRLLAGDSRRMRALRSWEALMPAPLPGEEHPTARMLGAERGERALRYMAPDFFAVHPIDAKGPEEEILLLDLAFRSTVPEATMRVPSFAAWLETVDQAPAYRAMARALKALSWQRRPAEEPWRWVLKTPHHLEWIDELFQVLQDPVIVWTHRDPLEVVPSFCSMIAHGRGVFSDQVDPHEIGSSWLKKAKRMVERAMAARGRLGAEHFIDIRYKDLIKDPVAAARQIQERAGLSFGPDTEARMRETLAHEKKDRHGVHRYALELFGLDASQVTGALGAYRAAFGV